MILTTLTFLPLLAGLICFLINDERAVRIWALIASTAVFILSLGVLFQFNSTTPDMQFVEKYAWVPNYGINYFVGVDGISLWLIMLTTFITPFAILGSWTSISKRVKAFHFSILMLETAMLGAFVSIDTVLFYFYWELMLIPMYLMIGVWGGDKRIYAAVKFFIYTMVGSVFMLVAIIALMYYSKEQLGAVSASLLDFYKLTIPFNSEGFLNPQTLMFCAFVLAFAIKVPMFPLHTWLPDAHVQAPTPGSVILAAVLLKMGTYGLLRFAIPLFPEATMRFAPALIAIAVFGIIYGAWVAMVQPDIKKLVAYSSVSHLGYVVLGLFVLNHEGVTGGIYQMLNHGVSTGGLFLLVGMIYERTHSRDIAKYGGLAKAMPVFTIFFFLITISSIAVPGTNGFIGEFLILLGGYKYSLPIAMIAVTGVVWGAVYMLWMFRRVFFGPAGELVPEVHDDHHGHGHGHDHGHKQEAAHSHKHDLPDLNWREVSVMVPLIILVFVMGIFPDYFISKTKTSVDHLIKNKGDYNLSIYQGANAADKLTKN